MSHEVSTPNPTLDAPEENAVEPKPVSLAEAPEADAVMDESADSVMDDVFDDVERMLRDGSTLPYEVVSPPQPSNPLSALAENLMPGFLAPRPDRPETDTLEIEVPNADEPDADLDGLAALAQEGGELAAVEDEAEDDAQTPTPITQKSFDSLLLTIATISVLVSGGLWLLAQIFWREPVPVATPDVAEPVAVSQADRAFMEYMQRSLDVIDQQVEVSQETAAIANANLPDVPVAGDATAAAPAGVLERVYVPVYQPPTQATVQPSGTVAAAPTAPVAPNAAPAPTTPGQVPNVAATVTHELVGLLELGDRSAALFDINGTAQRIELGEAIGSSGWTLVSVNNQEAIIRRNGEVRSVYIGQRF